MSVEIVTTPTLPWLTQRLQQCHTDLLVASPFVTMRLVDLIASAPCKVRKTLITRTDLRDFATGVSSLTAVCTLAETGVKVLSLPGLHAKAYLIDAAWALVTSANATDRGLSVNWECGLGTDDSAAVTELWQKASNGFGAPIPPSYWSLEKLRTLYKPTQAMKERIAPLPQSQFVTPDEIEVQFASEKEQASFLNSFGGWKRLVLEGVLAQRDDNFSLNDIYATCAEEAARRYPTNRTSQPKMRQSLQMLREMGLVDFLGNGKYRRTIHPNG